MPLIRGFGKDAFVKNLRALRAEGRPRPQCIAIGYSTARRALKARGLRETDKRRKEWKDAIRLGMSSKRQRSDQSGSAHEAARKRKRKRAGRAAAGRPRLLKIVPYRPRKDGLKYGFWNLEVSYPVAGRSSAYMAKTDRAIESVVKKAGGKWWASDTDIVGDRLGRRSIGFQFKSAATAMAGQRRAMRLAIEGLRAIVEH